MSTTLQNVWSRPALMILSESQPSEVDGATGVWNLGVADTNFIYLTDDSRSPLNVSIQRIEYKKRMINGRMRTYHVADKKSFAVSWRDLPSAREEISESKQSKLVNGWASSQEMLTWYKDHTDSFYLTLVYDTPSPAATGAPLKYTLEYYNVFFEEFNYTVNKRGQTHDLWDISMSLVEV